MVRNINEVSRTAVKLFENGNDVCITGRNMSGKSSVLRNIFIDYRPKLKLHSVNIIDDIEQYNWSGGGISDDLIDILQLFLVDLNIVIRNSILGQFTRNGIPIILVSRGIKRVVALITRLYYLYKNGETGFIIDNIDDHLDGRLSSILMSKIHEAFPNIQLIVATRSLTFFETLKNTKIIVLDDTYESYKIMDSRDLGNLEYINREVFNSYCEGNNTITRKIDILYMKVYNDIDLTKDELKYVLEGTGFSPGEKYMRSIILDEI